LRHAELRNCAERIIGIFKKRFRIINEDNFYPMEMQVRLVPALCALHNFIRIYDPLDEMDITDEEVEMYLAMERPAEGELQRGISAQETARSHERREQIALEMWAQYREYRDRANQQRNARRRANNAHS
jgi:hypothetical protein